MKIVKQGNDPLHWKVDQTYDFFVQGDSAYIDSHITANEDWWDDVFYVDMQVTDLEKIRDAVKQWRRER